MRKRRAERGLACLMAAMLAACLCCLCAACAGHGDDEAAPTGGATTQSQSTDTPSGGVIAASVAEYATYLLDHEDMSQRSDTVVGILRRVADGGTVSAAEYEAAWNDYRQCLTDRGYNDLPLTRYPHGTYWYPADDMSGMTQEQQDKLRTDEGECWVSNTMDVDTFYRMQTSDASLNVDNDVMTVDCLHKRSLVPTSYTVDQYKTETEEYEKGVANGKDTQDYSMLSFDPTDMNVRECQILAGDSTLTSDGSSWKPLG